MTLNKHRKCPKGRRATILPFATCSRHRRRYHRPVISDENAFF